jgi:predicted amidohydrolase
MEANYDKHHLLPGVEPEKPGDKRVLLDQPSGRWGLQICKDMDFPELSREYAALGANLLLVPAWDFNLDRWLHARMAVLRAVENGFALARSARNGLLTLSDNRGRIICGNGDGARPLRVDHWESKRRARANFLHANRRLVRLALCRPVGHPAGVSISCAINKPIAINCGLRERLADLCELAE